MTRDDKPMLAIYANGVDIAQRFSHVQPAKLGDPKPWHIAVVVWWRFVRRREALDIARKCGREAQP